MQTEALKLIDDINARQDDALRQIDELNARIEALVELSNASAKSEMEQTLDTASETTPSIEIESGSSEESHRSAA